MAKFLNTKGISYHLEELIKTKADRLILIRPYLQYSDRIKENINSLTDQTKDIHIIYRKNKLPPDETKWRDAKNDIRKSVSTAGLWKQKK